MKIIRMFHLIIGIIILITTHNILPAVQDLAFSSRKFKVAFKFAMEKNFLSFHF